MDEPQSSGEVLARVTAGLGDLRVGSGDSAVVFSDAGDETDLYRWDVDGWELTATMSTTEVAQLRDWLTAWFDRSPWAKIPLLEPKND